MVGKHCVRRIDGFDQSTGRFVVEPARKVGDKEEASLDGSQLAGLSDFRPEFLSQLPKQRSLIRHTKFLMCRLIPNKL